MKQLGGCCRSHWWDVIHHLWEFFSLFCKVSLLISTPLRCHDAWLIHLCKLPSDLQESLNINCQFDNEKFRCKGESVDLCTCLPSWISTVQWKSPICARESTSFLTIDNLFQSFLTFKGNNYFSWIFFILIVDFLKLNYNVCHCLHCEFIYFVMVDSWNGWCPSNITFLFPSLHT